MEQSDNQIATSLKTINDNIQSALKESQFSQSVRLVAVSKFKPADHVKEVYDCGVRDFGENYVDELAEKSAQLPQDIRWHFIGHLQSNKCKKVLIPNLECLETIDSIKLAEKVDKACESMNRDKLKVFVQVKTSDEDTKSGGSTEEVFEILNYIKSDCKHLVFAGLMTIGESGDMSAFKQMVELREKVCEKFQLQIKDVELSMGMSADYAEAVKYGSTNVRVGSLIFGERQKKAT